MLSKLASEEVSVHFVVSLVVTSCGVTAHEPQVAPKSAEDDSVQSAVSLVATVGVTAQEPVLSKLASDEVSVQRTVSAAEPVSVTAHEPGVSASKSASPLLRLQLVVSPAVSVSSETAVDVQLSGVVTAHEPAWYAHVATALSASAQEPALAP